MELTKSNIEKEYGLIKNEREFPKFSQQFQNEVLVQIKVNLSLDRQDDVDNANEEML